MRIPVQATVPLAAALLFGCTVTVTTADTTPHKPPPTQPQQPTPSATTPPPTHPIVKPHHIMVVNNKVQLPGPVVFDTGTANLRPESEPVLDVVVEFMKQEAQVNLVRVEGHTDGDGEPPTNMALSKERALAVTHWLVGKGVDCKRLLPAGFGMTMPIASNSTEEGKAQNRRVDFVKVIENGKTTADANGRPLPIDGGGQGQNAGDPCK